LPDQVPSPRISLDFDDPLVSKLKKAHHIKRANEIGRFSDKKISEKTKKNQSFGR
jgi:hypothetical protein